MKQKDATQLCVEGMKLIECGKVDEALTTFQTGLSVAKDANEKGTLQYNIALCHARKQNARDAIMTLVEVVKTYPCHYPTIREGKDFPELKNTDPFARFLAAARTYRFKTQLNQIKWGLVWFGCFLGACGVASFGSQFDLSYNGKAALGFGIVATCAIVITLFRFRIKRRWEVRTAEAFTNGVAEVFKGKEFGE